MAPSPSVSPSHPPQDEPSEQTPLINSANPPTTSPAKDASSKALPKFQIALLCYARMMEPIAFFSIFPYIAPMVQRNGNLPSSDVGFYSGLIESLFSAVQMVVLIFWGRLADRIGRRPVLVTSLIGTAIGPAIFGMSTTLWQMIAFRCLAGVFSGSSLIIRTMIAELSTSTTQAQAFAWFAFGGNLGIFLGPLIGGALADPVQQYPNAFKGITFFEEYPYALAGFAVGIVSATGALAAALFLRETIEKNPPKSTSDAPPPQEMTMLELVKSPGVGIVLWLYNHVMLLAFAFTAIAPIALYTPIDIGGLGFTSFMISIYMATQGASQALWLLLAFPWLQHRLGTKGVLRICGIAYPFFFAGYILLSALLRDGSHTAKVWFWIVGSFVAVGGPGVSMAFTGVQLALNDVAPSPRVLGTLNALALTASSGIRAIAPGVSTAVYAIGVRNQILGGHLIWVILIPLAAAFGAGVRWLPDDKKPIEEIQDEEEE